MSGEVLACRILQDGSIEPITGQVPPNLFTEGKGKRFLHRARRAGVAFDWELTGGTGVITCHGLRIGDEVLMFGSSQSQDLAEALDQITRINGEQANEIRALVRQAERSRRGLAGQTEQSQVELNEMTALNNELAALQREASRRSAELARLNEEKNTVLGMVVHDLRNPLTTVSGATTLLLSGMTGELGETQAGLLKSIDRSAKQMLEMVEQLLDLSAFESGTVRLDRRPLDLAEAVAEQLESLDSFAAGKAITLKRDLQSGLWLQADSGKLDQVLVNLVTNALKYSHTDTTVTITVVGEGGEAVLRVADMGQGIPADDLPTLFEPFTKANVRTTGGESSTGLGLAIVKRVVEAHGGTLGVTSVVGEGSVFEVRLPLDA